MSFDLSTAQPVLTGTSAGHSAFDLSTARPVYPGAGQAATAGGRQAQPSGLDGALSTLSRIANSVGEGVLSAGPVETAAHLATGTVGALGGGLGFLSQLATNGSNVDDAKQFQAKVQQDLTYQPRTTAGKAMAKAADKALGVIPGALNKAGEVTADVTGSPLLGAAVNTAGNAALNFLPLKGAGRALSGAEDAATAAALARDTTVPKPPSTPAELTQQSLDTGTNAGYKLPPNLDPNASTMDRLMQTLSGKANGEQRTQVPNQATTNQLAATAVGKAPSALLTKPVLQQIRQEAIASGYKPIEQLPGDIPVDIQFLRNNQAIKAEHGNELSGNPDVVATADLLNRASFDPANIVDMVSTLRSRAQDAFTAGRADAGAAFRKQAGELEALVDRHVSDLDDAPPGMLNKLRAARQLIAKTYTVEDNLNPSTGNVDATGIGQRLKDGTPLTGDLRTIADFANAAPSAVTVPKSIPLPSSIGTHLAGAALAHATHGASILALPAIRAFASNWIARRNETPGLLQPSNKTFGPTALDAVHGSAAAFSKLYGGGGAAGVLSTSSAPVPTPEQ